MTCQCSEAIKVSNHWFAPERFIYRRMGESYRDHPVMARVVATPCAALVGIIKVFLFPVMALVGVVAMPIIAAVRKYQGKGDSGTWLKAWAFSLLALTGSVGFLALSGYTFPLVASMGIMATGIAISITVHVFYANKEPKPYTKQ